MGIGWRNVVEKMLQNASVAEWYKQHGRHPVYAKGQDFPMPMFGNPITSRLQGEPLKLRVIGQ
jgi:7,8-dihydro-6-hydroxymethylpterin dimethyltransferase